ncbi:response regulator [Paracoccus sp. SCSIO 75233]|uniref:response regulator n=1 Tax=Paracoccus sp. SCSIO 75233 TaxID=3017782 RepID=UPI0022F03E49|nr:response regulator [Paracoccus sp. SCSIO 75233]WBU52466.1 response regulator [Paracoccus sp. SCSIO 75233]
MQQTQISAHRDVEPLWQAQLPGRPLSGLTVLVVEDSRIAAEAIRLLCLRSGARIRRADSLRTAMRHLQIYRPAVVIVDIGLPDGSGAELIDKIRQLGTKAPVVIGISGDPQMRQPTLDAGAAAFMEKPVESLAMFQQTILGALPKGSAPKGPRILPNDMIIPDQSALYADLTRISEALAEPCEGASVGYLARFLTGVARWAHDAPLARAAEELTRAHEAGQDVDAGLRQISSLVNTRLAGAGIN